MLSLHNLNVVNIVHQYTFTHIVTFSYSQYTRVSPESYKSKLMNVKYKVNFVSDKSVKKKTSLH